MIFGDPKAPCLLAEDQEIVVEAKGKYAIARRKREVDIKRCRRCEGQGMIAYMDEQGYSYVKPCEGRRLDHRIRRFNQGKIPARYVHATLENFRPLVQGHQLIVETLREYLEGFEPGMKGFFFMGEVGTGKTHLMVSCLKYLSLEKGMRIQFIEFSHLLSDIRALYGQNRSESELLNPLVEIPILGIDELGKGQNTEFEHRIIDELITRRYNQEGVTTFFTSNYYPEAMYEAEIFESGWESLEDRIGVRSVSRLHEMCRLLPLPGEDYRKFYKYREGF